MSHARQVFKGATLAVVRRCSEQRFFLAPSRRLNQVLAFLLAHYATKHHIQLHGFVFMANHFHLVLTDVEGTLPRFMGEFDALLTRVLNAPPHLNRCGSLWESGSYTSWPLETQEEVLNHLAYVAANPVEAHQVKDPGRWRGLISLPGSVGASRTVRPPMAGLFGRGHEGSALPPSAILTLEVPPCFPPSTHRFRSLFARALTATLTEILSRGGTFRGRDAVRDLDPFSAPAGARGAPSFGLIPALTNATAEKRAELKAWRAAYRAAFYAWQAKRSTVFPAGTWQMVQRHKAKVAPG